MGLRWAPLSAARRPPTALLLGLLSWQAECSGLFVGMRCTSRPWLSRPRPTLAPPCRSSTIDPITSKDLAQAAEGTLLHAEAAAAHNTQYPYMVDA